MARKSRQARPSVRQKGRRGGGFLRGLALGLAVAAGVQLHHGGLPDWFDGSGGGDGDPAGRIEPPKTNFDFYRLLPKTEVRVDDPAAPAGTPRPAERTAPPSPSAAPRPATATPRPETATPPPATAAPRPTTAASAPPPREPATAAAPASGPREYRVQAGSFREKKEADRLRASLALGGFESRIQTRDTANGTRHRVVLGPFRGREAAEEAKARLRTAQGIDALIVQ